jgi:hypothetical protein
MKSLRTRYPALLNTGWSMLAGTPPAAPARELTPKAAQVVADQEWEDEGGSCKPAKKPGTEPETKIPF